MNKRYAVLIALSLFAVSKTYAQNGGTSCATAVPLIFDKFFAHTADTTNAPNWMNSFGPLISPSNDVVYSFVAPTNLSDFTIFPAASSYAFALYLIPSCTTGAEPTPIGATATVGSPVNSSNITTPLISGNTYYLAVTGTAAGGVGANGTVTFETFQVTLQSFEVE